MLLKKASSFALVAILLSSFGLPYLIDDAYSQTSSQSTTTVTLTVQSADLSGTTFEGMWVDLFQNGVIIQSGFTPFTAQIDSNTEYTVDVANSFEDITFDHWDDSNTSPARAFFISQDTTFTAFYQTGTTPTPTSTSQPATATLTVQSADMSGTTFEGMWVELFQNGQLIDSGFTPFTTTVDTNAQYVVDVAVSFEDITFDHWDDSSTSPARAFSTSQDATFTAFYQTGASTTSSTNSFSTDAFQSVTFSGRAIGVIASDADSQFFATFADTGELPPEGGKLTADEPSAADVLFSTGILHSVTTGFDEQAESTASAADVMLLADTENQITADFVRATSQVNCVEDPASTEIRNLIVKGQPIVVTGEPNQVVVVSEGWLTLIINEQEISLNTDEQGNVSNFVKVNGLHLISDTGEEVIVASAKSDIKCEVEGEKEVPPISEACTFVTGGGFIAGASDGGNGKANFGFNARPDLRGHINYLDKTTSPKLHVKIFGLDSFECVPKCPDNPNPPNPASEGARLFSGPAEINGAFGSATICVEDNGEPGNQPKGSDWFSITLSDGYHNSGLLEGGNIQVHKQP